MDFCPKCGGMILPQEVEEEDDKQIVLKCSTCGYDSSEVDKAEYSIEKKVETPDTVTIWDEGAGNHLSSKICPWCKNNSVIIEIRQVKGIAEGPTYFFKCTKCDRVWRI